MKKTILITGGLGYIGSVTAYLLYLLEYDVIVIGGGSAGISSAITSGMAGGSIFAGLFGEPYDIHDNHSRYGVVISLLVALLIIG